MATSIFQRITFPTVKELGKLLLPIAGVAVAYCVDIFVPTVYPVDYVTRYYPSVLLALLVAYLAVFAFAVWTKRVRDWTLHKVGYFTMAFLLGALFDMLTVKSGFCRLPYVPGPDQVISAYADNAGMVLNNLYWSALLLVEGVSVGVVAGLIYGSLMGYSRFFGYWLEPIIKIIGPVPSTAWVVLFMVLAPSSHAASVALVAITVWFPLSIQLGNSIRSVDKRYVEKARVAGASRFFILTKVVAPAVTPAFFNGLFMGLCNSFTSLYVAEMLGVKGGLGWYLHYAGQWNAFDRIFGTILIYIALTFLILTILFKIQKHVMKWQNGMVKW